MWTTIDAIELCREIEAICPALGCHVALTGGLLYKDGDRKDADIVLYRIRQVEEIDIGGLLAALSTIGIHSDATAPYRWLIKAAHHGRSIDFLFPDFDGQYPTAAAQQAPDLDSEVIL